MCELLIFYKHNIFGSNVVHMIKYSSVRKDGPYHPCSPLSVDHNRFKAVFCCSNAGTGGWSAEKEENGKKRGRGEKGEEGRRRQMMSGGGG